jgi:hypothetical protein
MDNACIHPLDERPLIRELVGEIEALRTARKQQWRDRPHPDTKRFTQEELTDLVCPSYRNLLMGRTARLPSRALVLAIADYLECTIHETNDLLLAAQYVPKQIALRDDQYRAFVEYGRTLAHALPLPAFLVGGAFHVIDANASGVSLTQTEPSRAASSFHYTFDPQLPTYRMLAAHGESWAHNARTSVRLLQSFDPCARREPWYRTLIKQLLAIPQFCAYWNEVPSSLPHQQDVPTYCVWDPKTNQRFEEQLVLLPLTPLHYPFLVVHLPIDPTAHTIFAALGCQVTENRWEQALALSAAHGVPAMPPAASPPGPPLPARRA